MNGTLTFLVILLTALCPVAGQQLGTSSFRAIDVFVDAGNEALAAYQLTFVGTNGVKIVGVEGGEHSAFAEAPYYDPQAMQNDRVIFGAFNTSRDVPRGRVRVATIHVRTQSNQLSAYRIEVNAAATTDGKPIAIEVNFEERTAR